MTKVYTVEDLAQPLANYPHAHRAGDLIFVSGVSCRQKDDSHAGVEIDEEGNVERDIVAQSEAVIENLQGILEGGGAGLRDVVDVTVFLTNMDDYAAFNEVYNRHFDADTGPARTTVAVKELPHPNLLVELKAVAYAPGSP
ncbi:MAG: RidA family protein [Persicimonas sp.]